LTLLHSYKLIFVVGDATIYFSILEMEDLSSVDEYKRLYSLPNFTCMSINV